MTPFIFVPIKKSIKRNTVKLNSKDRVKDIRLTSQECVNRLFFFRNLLLSLLITQEEHESNQCILMLCSHLFLTKMKPTCLLLCVSHIREVTIPFY
jgi:hypothetical protein